MLTSSTTHLSLDNVEGTHEFRKEIENQAAPATLSLEGEERPHARTL